MLEFTRAERAGEAHALRFAPQTYLLRTPGGGFNSAEFPWTRDLLDDLRAVRDPSRGPEVVHRLGEALRGFLAGDARRAGPADAAADTDQAAPHGRAHHTAPHLPERGEAVSRQSTPDRGGPDRQGRARHPRRCQENDEQVSWRFSDMFTLYAIRREVGP